MFTKTIALIELRIKTLIACRNDEDKRRRWAKDDVERMDETIAEYTKAVAYLRKADKGDK